MTWWANDQVGHNREAKAHAKRLSASSEVFSTPKPERLLQRVLQIGSNPGDIVFDCFAGSGTTAATAHKMGRRDREPQGKLSEEYFDPSFGFD